MSDFRRLYLQGGIYFFTLVTYDRRQILCSKIAIDRLKDAFKYTNIKHPFCTEALVVLPDHLHCIWRLPENDADFSARWSMIKRYFSIGMEGKSNHRCEKNVWQRKFWEHMIRDEDDYQNCLDYIHYNPVKHGYVNCPSDWKYTTFKRDVQNELYTKNFENTATPKNIKYFFE